MSKLAVVYADLIVLEMWEFKNVPNFFKKKVKAELEKRGLGHLAE